jgi:glycosyltransferase involved in cell wall biosynthesis
MPHELTMDGLQCDDAKFALIGLSLSDWFGQWVNRQQLLSRIGRVHRVVYSTGAWTVWERGDAARKASPVVGGTTRADNVIVESAPRVLLRWPGNEWVDRAAVAVHACRLRYLARQRGSATVAMLFDPTFYPYVRYLRPDLIAYHAYDLFSATPGWSPRLERMENALLREAHLVTAVSSSIVQNLGARVEREIKFLPNGVDLDAFAAVVQDGAAAPPDLASIPRPRIGYLGSLHPQVDYGLIAELARRRPAWQFVFVGGRIEHRHAQAERELELCRSLSNIHFLGAKSHNDVPSYAVNMDINIMCYRLSEKAWTTAIYPLKLHEYFAAGAPIVSVDLASVREFAKWIRIATGPDEWVQAIEASLAETDPKLKVARRQVAEQNGWEERARQLSGWLAAALQTKNVGGGN